MKKIDHGIIFFSCTAGKKEDTLLYKSFKELGIKNYVFAENFKGSINKQYNKFLNSDKIRGYKVAILCHDDITINTTDLDPLRDDKWTIFGLAGTKECKFQRPFLWHLVAPRSKLCGTVAHYKDNSYTEYFDTKFGPTNEHVLMIDGVLIGINLSKWCKGPVLFDENIPSNFHFYDLVFSLNNSFFGNKVGVIDFPIIHRSHGLDSIDNKDWVAGQEYVLKKYESYAGYTIQA